MQYDFLQIYSLEKDIQSSLHTLRSYNPDNAYLMDFKMNLEEMTLTTGLLTLKNKYLPREVDITMEGTRLNNEKYHYTGLNTMYNDMLKLNDLINYMLDNHYNNVYSIFSSTVEKLRSVFRKSGEPI